MRKQRLFIKGQKEEGQNIIGDEVEAMHLIQGVGLDIVFDVTNKEPSGKMELMLMVEQIDGTRVMHNLSAKEMDEIIVVYERAKKRLAKAQKRAKK